MSSASSQFTATATATALSIVAIISFSFISYRNRIVKGGKKPEKLRFQLPDDVKFLDQRSFEVLSALCDAFFPALTAAECCTEGALHAAMDLLHPALRHQPDLIFGNTTALLGTQQQQQQQNNGLFPYLCRGAIESEVHVVAARALQKLTTAAEQQQLFLLMKLLSTAVGAMLTTGFPAAVQDLPLQQRIRLLANFRDSPLIPLRAFYQTIKRVTANIFFSYVEHGEMNAAWEAIQYDPKQTVSKQLTTAAAQQSSERKAEIDRLLRDKVNYESVKQDLKGKNSSSSGSDDDGSCDVLEADVVVVGSGSGGGMIASELAKSGLRVLLLEKGGHFRAAEFSEWRECQAMQHAFEKGGLCTSSSGSVLVLAGSCLGGGSSVNWSASFRTPDCVRDDWVHKQRLPAFAAGGEFEESMDEVHRLLNVNTDCSYRVVDTVHTASTSTPTTTTNATTTTTTGTSGTTTACGEFAMNENNRLLWKGAERAGYVPEKIPRNVRSCVDCGHCCFGCPYESKQSTLTALIEPKLLQMHQPKANAAVTTAATHDDVDEASFDLHVIPHCYAHKVLYETCPPRYIDGSDGQRFLSQKRAVGVEATVRLYSQSMSQLSVRQRLQLLDSDQYTTRKVLIRSKIVVSSAGSLHTPALLLRSGLHGQYGNGGNGLVGANLSLHPVLGVGGLFDKDTVTGLNSGVSMGVVIRNPPIYAGSEQPKNNNNSNKTATTAAAVATSDVNFDDDCYFRVAPETPPLHAGLMGLMFPWTAAGGLGVKLGVLGWRNSSTFIGISRDRSCAENRVSIDAAGNPVIHYDVTKRDAAMLLAGLEANLRMMRAAGARFLYVAHENSQWHHVSSKSVSASSADITNGSAVAYSSVDESKKKKEEEEEEEERRFESFLANVKREGVQPISMQIFSAHQMSSCRMAATPLEGPVSPSGELYECSDLFVADGSLLPTSLGINPMIVIESMAHMVAKHVLNRVITAATAGDYASNEMAGKVRRFVAAQKQRTAAGRACNDW